VEPKAPGVGTEAKVQAPFSRQLTEQLHLRPWSNARSCILLWAMNGIDFALGRETCSCRA